MKTRALLSAVSVAWCTFALAHSGGPPTAAEHIAADVARLAGPEWEGRRAGTRGADLAADWIGAEFKRIGLRPGGAGGSYFQDFTFVDGVVLGPDNRLAIAGQPPGTPWRMDVDFRPLVFSGAGKLSGEVVFAGYGIVAPDLGYDDYAGMDVKDKIVLLLRFGPGGDDPHSKWAAFTPLRLKVSNARDRGARAVLVATGPRPESARDELVAIRGEAALADAGIPALSVRRAVAEDLVRGSGTTLEELQQRIDEGGKPAARALPWPVTGSVDLAPKRSRTRNVLGLLPGTGGTQETIVIGAHYDHLGLGMSYSLDPAPDGKVHAGADDNASGVSGLLELARRLVGRPQRRAILFAAFGAEEEGTLGSSHFVKDPPLPLDRVVAMLNMDMIGRLREDSVAVQGTGTSERWAKVLEQANAGLGLKLKTSEGGYGPSDHSPFYAAGRPVLLFFTGAHEDYHRPSDTSERVNAAGIARVADLVEGIVTRLAASDEPVPFTRVAAEKETQTATRGFRVWVGGIPDYSAEGPGVRFTGVTPGSPAEKAGVQAGDVLVRFGARDVRNVYDYTYALADHRPGDKVAIVVRRGGADVPLEVVLGSRPGAGR
jgi:acetylornithine deacetylase/succinyl-diaminopimelate desuccinylase-like protein